MRRPARRMWGKTTAVQTVGADAVGCLSYSVRSCSGGEGLAGTEAQLWSAFVDEDVDVDLVGFL